jgi:hypothetical protein
MAKNFVKPRKHETGRSITTKTPYGITSDMVVNDNDILSKVNIPDSCVLVKDDDGYFIVNKERINDGLACPLRYDIQYRHSMNQKIMEELNTE